VLSAHGFRATAPGLPLGLVTATTRRLRFTTQALLLHLGVLVLVLGAGLGLVILLLHSELERQFERRALAIAHTVSADPEVAQGVLAGPPSRDGVVERLAEGARRRTGALFVVVTDGRGVRYSHPNRDEIGRVVSTDPSVALAGHDVANIEKGTLGLSARGKTPLRDDAGAVIGEVSVGIDARDLHARLISLLEGTAGFGAIALLVGVLGAGLLARRLKRQTLGLEPAELADLVLEHEAVLHGVRDGVVAVERTEAGARIAMSNDEARRLLGDGVVEGAPVTVLPTRLARFALGGTDLDEQVVVTGSRTLDVTTRRVARLGRDLGTVLTLRDRTKLDHLGRDLDTVRALFDALRAQSHEHSNRLHAVAGMLQLGHVEEASAYLEALSGDPLSTGDDVDRIRDPYLRGLLAAKASAAAERGVRLQLSEDSSLDAGLTAPMAVVTVVGNLVDNAVRAAAEGARRPAWVEVAVAGDDTALTVGVRDSGDGLASDAAELAFADGWTTRPDDAWRHGLGLALARQTARRHDGDVELVSAGGPDHGAVFVARLRGVLVVPAAGVRA
jgi:two-component system, CitB family, sensor kinase